MVYLLLPLPGKKEKVNMIRFSKVISIKSIKDTEPTLLNPMIFMLKTKLFFESMINRDQVKVSALTVANLAISVKTVTKSLVN